jgi:hypothetical protein
LGSTVSGNIVTAGLGGLPGPGGTPGAAGTSNDPDTSP